MDNALSKISTKIICKVVIRMVLPRVMLIHIRTPLVAQW